MNENEMNQEVINEAPVVEEQTTVAEVTESSTKTGLTNGQKAIGLGVIGFAIFGFIQVIRLLIKGVKFLFGKAKGGFKKAKAKVAAAVEAAGKEDEIDPDDIIEAEELPPEEK